MRVIALFILCFSCSVFFGSDWSDNGIIKFTAGSLGNFEGLQDYNNIIVTNGFVVPTSETNCYLLTEKITIGDNYIFSSAFVNFSRPEDAPLSSNSYVTLKIFDNADDETIRKQVFYKSGAFELNNIFLRNAV